MTAADIQTALSIGLGTGIAVRARRPGLYQIHVPAYLADGDGAAVYVKALGDARVRVTDIGQTCMRLSYTRKIDSDVINVLSRLATWHGMKLEDGELATEVPANEIMAAMLALLQVEAAAEASIVAATKKRASTESFRTEVRDLLQRTFREACHFDYFDEKTDAQGLWKLDAMIEGPRANLGIAIIAGTTEGERAVGTAFHVRPALRGARADSRHFLIALPRDINDLPELTRKRVMSEYLVPVPAFAENPAKVPERLEELAA
jgi:hypothetical protein